MRDQNKIQKRRSCPADRSLREKGAVVAYMAIIMPVMLGGLGLAIDNGRLYSVRRQMQTAADATALAAAHEWRNQNYENYAAVAKEDALLNGFDENEGVEIDVNVPPLSGPRAGDGNYVEVIIREEVPLYFMRAFNKPATVVESRAVAGLVPADACVYILDPTASKALSVGGSARLTLEGCGVHVNSNSSSAATTNGGGMVTATAVGVVGNYTGSGFFPTPQTGVYQAPDPLKDLPAPPSAGCTFIEPLVIQDTQVLNPGNYCGGIQITSQGHVTLNPGMYVLNGGGLDVQAGATLIGDGVTFYNTAGGGYSFEPVEFMSNSTTQLSAPTSGTYKGILFFQDRSIPTANNKPNKFAGTPDTEFRGTLYFPLGDVDYVGTSGTVAQETMLLARTAEFHGTADLTMFAKDSDMLPTALAIARVVE